MALSKLEYRRHKLTAQIQDLRDRLAIKESELVALEKFIHIRGTRAVSARYLRGTTSNTGSCQKLLEGVTDESTRND